jgi:hypothetical protein
METAIMLTRHNQICVMLVVALGVLMLCAAHAQERSAPPDHPLGAVGRWFDGAFSSIGSQFKSAGQGVDNLGREAGMAARASGNAVKDAAETVAKIPTTKVMTGKQTCIVAANGAPDCAAAANRLCQKHGFSSGSSVDITSSRDCPMASLLGQREERTRQCRDNTTVTSAVCLQ